MAKKLTDKQEIFVAEYLIHLNATQAAIRAGYSKKTAGSQAFDLLKKPEIQEALSNAKAERSERTKIDADYVLTQAQKLHERCMQAEPVYDDDGNPTGEYVFKETGAARALEIIGKHVNVKAFDNTSNVVIEDKTTLLAKARQRAAAIAGKKP